jgi:hypothetical protein
MKNNGLFSSLFIEELKDSVKLDDAAHGRMATLAQTWRTRSTEDTESLWESFLKQALSYLEFVPPGNPSAPGVYPLYEDYNFSKCISVLYLAPPESDIDNTSVGSFYSAKLLAQLKERKLNWGILTDGASWRLYSTKSSRPYEDYVELPLEQALEGSDEAEYGLFERFFHKDSFIAEEAESTESKQHDESAGIYKCRLDRDREQSEKVLDEEVKAPFLAQVDEVLQYICNGFIFDTHKNGEEYTEEERWEIFESAVKLIYRCLFLFYAEARRLLPSDPDKVDLYQRHSIQALCEEARKFRWGERRDTDQYDLWKHLKGLVNAVNDGDPEYGIMGYNGGLFDDEEERFLGQHQLRNDFLFRALYLLAFVEPYDNEPDEEYAIPYEDLEVRHLGELYETILEYTVQLADTDRIRRRTKKGVEMLLASQTTKKAGDRLIKKGDVYFGESALERKQTGSYYTPESLVRFLNEKTIVNPLRKIFERKYRQRFNDLLEQASNGHDIGTRRGAAQSAAALVKRFAENELLKFKVCDLAMGSGHFLVDAANQMAGLVVALLEEVPQIEGMTVSVTSRPNDWRRRITRHCIYGVDLNPLAVNLAKLSLWLNCFAIEHKLTFLDHHVRCGNSLIGIRSFDQLATIPERKKGSKKKDNQSGELFPDFQEYASVLAQAGQDVQFISMIDEDKTDEQKSVFDNVQQKVSAFKPLADLYTSYLMNGGIRPDDYHALFYSLAKKQKIQNPLNPDLPKILGSLDSYESRHHFFHWPLEFPEVFGTDAMGGFSANIGNPPWNIVKPNSQEFFSDYDPKFRSFKKQEANRVSKKLMADNPAVADKWDEYCEEFAEQSAYFKEPLSYSVLGKGDINTCKLFLEQFFTVLGDGGRMGIVVPSGLYTDQGCQPLREGFFNRSRVEFLYCFENRQAVFNIHRSFKFVLFGTQKGGKTDRFKCAFMEHDPERLPVIDANALKMSVKQVRKFSPDTLSVMEFKNQRDIDVTTKIYGDWPLLGEKLDDSWNVRLTREFDTSTDSGLFKEEKSDCPLYEGKIIWSYDNRFSSINYWLAEEDVRQREIRKKWRELSKQNKEPETYDYLCFRCGFRRIAASTNERTCLSTMIPPMVTCPDTTVTVSRIDYDSVLGRATELISLNQSLVLLSFLNSFALDFVVRQKITTHLDMHFMYGLPVPRGNMTAKHVNTRLQDVVSRVARLVCANSDYESMWAQAFRSDWTESAVWYPPSAPIDTYGPAHEQEIRRQLRDDAKNLTPEWALHCGVHDRLPDRRDTGDRAQLRAEIDAYVAHLYGLSRNDFAYILDTFPVLKKKEKKAFGEFMSKRKCLEEYDRIGEIINAE